MGFELLSSSQKLSNFAFARASKVAQKQLSRTWVFIKTRFNTSLRCPFMGKVCEMAETLGKPEFRVIMKHETRQLSCGLGFLLQNIWCSSFG